MLSACDHMFYMVILREKAGTTLESFFPASFPALIVKDCNAICSSGFREIKISSY